ncbi:MAG: isoleucine--tRNA ligase [Bacteroidota bacterium]
MKNYREYQNQDYPNIAREVLEEWKKNKVFEKSITTRKDSPTFTFYEGPPSANGTPGIHHVMARTVKDIFCRFKTMKGFKVERKGGWDTHGLPVELQVEKELGITKDDIGKKISVEEYNAKCREAVMKFKGEWDDLTEKMGYWLDLDDPYITFEKDYIESVWSLLKKLFDKGLLYKGYTIQPFSPKAGTGLSSHELNQPGTYRDVKDTSIVAQFKINGTENDYFLAWTTTPWTLPANSALAVGKNIDYVKVSTFNPYTFEPVNVILAEELIPKYFIKKAEEVKLEDYKKGDKVIPFKIVSTFKGSDLLGTEYEQLLPYVPLEKPAFTVVAGDFVTTEDGTGIVHISKTFGADDYKTSVENGIPGVLVKDENGFEVPVVDRQGRFVKEITDFAGKYVKSEYESDEVLKDPNYKSTDVLIAIKLKEENKAFKVEKYEHSYPHCWRTDKPILYYPLDSWFIKTTAFKDKLVELNKTINWKPASTGIGRFGNWLENLVDWNLSRSRYWGTPLPVWATEDREETKCIGSFEELKSEVHKSIEAGFMKKELDESFDLHRPYVDDVVLVSDSGKKMYRETDLIDVWFDSGAMPYAQWHYPFENKENFKNNYPADFIAEGVDQTRGWFFTLHAIAGMLFDQVAFKNVIANGLVLDKKGNKMSKRLGNAVNPFETLEKYGADPTRWYMISNANPWDNLKFDLDGITEVQRRFFGTLFNTYSFFALYANLDGFDPAENIDNATLTESDRWIISKLNTLVNEVESAYSDYEPTKATRAIQNFTTEDLSNWYVRLNRKRFWKGEFNEDKKAAYSTLHTCLITIAQLSAPIAPFYMDRLFQDLNAHRTELNSVHLSGFPTSESALIDKALEHKMDFAQRISSMVHSLRKKHSLRVRQPLSKILLPISDQSERKEISEVERLIRSEVNIKEIEFIDDDSGVLTKKIKPNFKKLGRELGPKMKEASKAISILTQQDISKIESTNQLEIALGEEKIMLSLEDVEIQSDDIPGWSVVSENGLTVALDITLTEELHKEGIARDFINRIQNLRKEKGLDVQDKISIEYHSEQQLVNDALKTYEKLVSNETQAISMLNAKEASGGESIEVDEFKVSVLINS